MKIWKVLLPRVNFFDCREIRVGDEEDDGIPGKGRGICGNSRILRLGASDKFVFSMGLIFEERIEVEF